FHDRELVQSMPTSMGRGGWATYGDVSMHFWTQSGVYTVLDKASSVLMDSTSYGLPITDTTGYKVTVAHGVRISNNGIYFHAMPETVWAQGNTNTSHGCLNRSAGNAQRYFDQASTGDVVEIRGTGGPELEQWKNGDWSVPGDKWQSGYGDCRPAGGAGPANPHQPLPDPRSEQGHDHRHRDRGHAQHQEVRPLGGRVGRVIEGRQHAGQGAADRDGEEEQRHHLRLERLRGKLGGQRLPHRRQQQLRHGEQEQDADDPQQRGGRAAHEQQEHQVGHTHDEVGQRELQGRGRLPVPELGPQGGEHGGKDDDEQRVDGLHPVRGHLPAAEGPVETLIRVDREHGELLLEQCPE